MRNSVLMKIRDLNIKFGTALQIARGNKGLSLEDAAVYLKCDPVLLRSIEEKPIEVPLKDLFQVIKLYDVPAESMWDLQVFRIN